MSSSAEGPFRLGEWTVRPRESSLERDGECRRIEPKLMEVLVFLAAEPERVHLRREILDSVWQDTFVTEEVLTNAVWELRQALGDDARSPRFIRTVPRRGYGLVAPVGVLDAGAGEGGPPAERRPGAAPRRRLLSTAVWLGGGLALALGLLSLWVVPPSGAGAAWPHSIAVMPIEGLSDQRAQRTFAAALTDSLTTELAASGRYEVPSRSSVVELAGKGLTATEIARRLDADAFLEGTLSFSAEGRARLSVQLIDRRRDRHLWAHTFEDDVRDNLSAQRRLARRVTLELWRPGDFPARSPSLPAAPLPSEADGGGWRFRTGGEVWSSPRAGEGGTLLVGSDDGNLYALDRRTGEERWRFAAPARVRDAVALGRSRVFLATGGYVQCVDATTGGEVWRRHLSMISPPTYVEQGQGLLVGGSYDRHLYGLDPADGSPLWAVPTSGENRTPAAVSGDRAVVGTDAGELLVVDLRAGRARVRLRLDSPVAGVATGPGDEVFAATERGFLYRLGMEGAERWRRNLGSRLGSAPLVGDGVLYQGTGDGRVLALDPGDGGTLWTFTARDGIGSTPRLSGTTLYVGSLDHDLYALDAISGDELWRVHTGGWVVARPLVTADRVVFSGVDGVVYAVPLGGPSELPADPPWPDPGTPRFTTAAGIATPHLLWRQEVRGPRRLLVDGGRVVVTTAAGVVDLDAASGDVLWRFAAAGGVEAAPLVDGGRVFFGSTGGVVFSLASERGTELWRHRLGAGTVAGAAAADGVVYLGDDDGRVYALDEATGAALWSAQTGHFVNDAPLVLADRVLVGSCDEYVWAFGRRRGRTLWKSHAGECVVSDGVVWGDLAIYGSYSGEVVALDVATGDRRWTFATRGPHIWYRPLVAAGTVYVGSGDYNLYALDAASGEERWRFETGNRALTEVARHGAAILFGSHDRHLYAVDGETGKELWRAETTRTVQHLAVVDDVLYFLGDDRYVFAYQLSTGR